MKSAPKANIGVVAPGPGHTTGPKHVPPIRSGLSAARRSTALGTSATPYDSASSVRDFSTAKIAGVTSLEETPCVHVCSTGTGGTVTVGTTGTTKSRGTTKSVAGSVVKESKGKSDADENAKCI